MPREDGVVAKRSRTNQFHLRNSQLGPVFPLPFATDKSRKKKKNLKLIVRRLKDGFFAILASRSPERD